MATPFRFDRAWSFAVAPEELWTTLEQTDRYRHWWPWLREFHVHGNGFVEGSVANLLIQAPLPWAHDRIVERGLDQFEERALQSRRPLE